MKKLLLLKILLFSIVANAADYMPYPEAKITLEQWNTYYLEVKTSFANSEKVYPDHNLATYSDDKTRMSFAFTTKGHPAHPSWITRQIVESNGSIDMQQIGYFAGEEKAFAVLFQQYAKLTEQTRKQFQK
ncbi:MAG: hypothetical protein ACW7DN_17220 [Paraglaciecola chathamensis]